MRGEKGREMALTLTVTDVDLGLNLLYVFGSVAVSGNYPTGGDTVDWTTLKGQYGRFGQIVDSSMQDPSFGPVQASFMVQGGTPNLYNMQQGAAANNWKMRGYAAGGVEFTGNSAYPGSATGDIITFQAVFRKAV